jgi:hypothetical protein
LSCNLSDAHRAIENPSLATAAPENDVVCFNTFLPPKWRRTQPHGGGKVIHTPPEPEHFDDVSLAVPDDRNFVYTYRKSGKTVAEGHATRLKDGKIKETTLTVLPRRPDERPFIENLYLVKQ